MAKLPLKLKARIPNFMKDSHSWRRAIHAAVVEVQDQSMVRYTASDKLEVHVRLHLENPKLTILDLDNRLKDILDALQGFVGDKGHTGELRPIIPNDSQIYRLIVEKRRPPKRTLKRPASSRSEATPTTSGPPGSHGRGARCASPDSTG